MNLKYILKIFVFVFIIFSLFIFVYNAFYSKFIEGLENNEREKPDINTSISLNFADDFCNNNGKSGNELNKKCQELTKTNCQDTKCCIWYKNKKGEKCIAGDKTNGPLFPEV